MLSGGDVRAFSQISRSRRSCCSLIWHIAINSNPFKSKSFITFSFKNTFLYTSWTIASQLLCATITTPLAFSITSKASPLTGNLIVLRARLDPLLSISAMNFSSCVIIAGLLDSSLTNPIASSNPIALLYITRVVAVWLPLPPGVTVSMYPALRSTLTWFDMYCLLVCRSLANRCCPTHVMPALLQ